MAIQGDLHQFEQEEDTTMKITDYKHFTANSLENSVISSTSSTLWHNFRSNINGSGKICFKNWLKSFFAFFLEQKSDCR